MPTLQRSNYQSLSIHQNNLSSLHGVFAFLKELNGKYGSRYTIEGSHHDQDHYSTFLDKYYENNDNYVFWSTEEDPEIIIRFNSTFLLTGYALMNGVQASSNSAPTGWDIYGVDSRGTKILLDKQSDQKFCETKSQRFQCSIMSIKGYQIKTQFKGFKEFIFHQTENSNKFKWLFLKSIDLFGTLCGIGEKCTFKVITCNIKRGLHTNLIFIIIFFS